MRKTPSQKFIDTASDPKIDHKARAEVLLEVAWNLERFAMLVRTAVAQGDLADAAQEIGAALGIWESLVDGYTERMRAARVPGNATRARRAPGNHAPKGRQGRQVSR